MILCNRCKSRNRHCLGKSVYISKGQSRKTNAGEISVLRKRGWTIGRLAKKFKLTDRRIFQILASKD